MRRVLIKELPSANKLCRALGLDEDQEIDQPQLISSNIRIGLYASKQKMKPLTQLVRAYIFWLKAKIEKKLVIPKELDVKRSIFIEAIAELIKNGADVASLCQPDSPEHPLIMGMRAQEWELACRKDVDQKCSFFSVLLNDANMDINCFSRDSLVDNEFSPFTFILKSIDQEQSLDNFGDLILSPGFEINHGEDFITMAIIDHHEKSTQIIQTILDIGFSLDPKYRISTSSPYVEKSTGTLLNVCRELESRGDTLGKNRYGSLNLIFNSGQKVNLAEKDQTGNTAFMHAINIINDDLFLLEAITTELKIQALQKWQSMKLDREKNKEAAVRSLYQFMVQALGFDVLEQDFNLSFLNALLVLNEKVIQPVLTLINSIDGIKTLDQIPDERIRRTLLSADFKLDNLVTEMQSCTIDLRTGDDKAFADFVKSLEKSDLKDPAIAKARLNIEMSGMKAKAFCDRSSLTLSPIDFAALKGDKYLFQILTMCQETQDYFIAALTLAMQMGNLNIIHLLLSQFSFDEPLRLFKLALNPESYQDKKRQFAVIRLLLDIPQINKAVLNQILGVIYVKFSLTKVLDKVEISPIIAVLFQEIKKRIGQLVSIHLETIKQDRLICDFKLPVFARIKVNRELISQSEFCKLITNEFFKCDKDCLTEQQWNVLIRVGAYQLKKQLEAKTDKESKQDFKTQAIARNFPLKLADGPCNPTMANFDIHLKEGFAACAKSDYSSAFVAFTKVDLLKLSEHLYEFGEKYSSAKNWYAAISAYSLAIAFFKISKIKSNTGKKYLSDCWYKLGLAYQTSGLQNHLPFAIKSYLSAFDLLSGLDDPDSDNKNNQIQYLTHIISIHTGNPSLLKEKINDVYEKFIKVFDELMKNTFQTKLIVSQINIYLSCLQTIKLKRQGADLTKIHAKIVAILLIIKVQYDKQLNPDHLEQLLDSMQYVVDNYTDLPEDERACLILFDKEIPKSALKPLDKMTDDEHRKRIKYITNLSKISANNLMPKDEWKKERTAELLAHLNSIKTLQSKEIEFKEKLQASYNKLHPIESKFESRETLMELSETLTLTACRHELDLIFLGETNIDVKHLEGYSFDEVFFNDFKQYVKTKCEMANINTYNLRSLINRIRTNRNLSFGEIKKQLIDFIKAGKTEQCIALRDTDEETYKKKLNELNQLINDMETKDGTQGLMSTLVTLKPKIEKIRKSKYKNALEKEKMIESDLKEYKEQITKYKLEQKAFSDDARAVDEKLTAVRQLIDKVTTLKSRLEKGIEAIHKYDALLEEKSKTSKSETTSAQKYQPRKREDKKADERKRPVNAERKKTTPAPKNESLKPKIQQHTGKKEEKMPPKSCGITVAYKPPNFGQEQQATVSAPVSPSLTGIDPLARSQSSSTLSLSPQINSTKLQRDYLKSALIHLWMLGIIYVEHGLEKKDKVPKSEDDKSVISDIIHYSLCYLISCVFTALKSYSLCGGKTSDALPQPDIISFRNAVTYRGALLAGKKEVRQTANKVFSQVPTDLIQDPRHKEQLLAYQCDQEQLLKLFNAFKLDGKGEPQKEKKDFSFPLTIEETELYLQLAGYHRFEQVADTTDDELIQIVWDTIIPRIKNIMSTLKGYEESPKSEQERERFLKSYMPQFLALKMLFVLAGEYRTESYCDKMAIQIRRLKSVDEKDRGNSVLMYVFLSRARTIRNKFAHADTNDCSVRELFELRAIINGISSKPCLDPTKLISKKDEDEVAPSEVEARAEDSEIMTSISPSTGHKSSRGIFLKAIAKKNFEFVPEISPLRV